MIVGEFNTLHEFGKVYKFSTSYKFNAYKPRALHKRENKLTMRNTYSTHIKCLSRTFVTNGMNSRNVSRVVGARATPLNGCITDVPYLWLEVMKC